jgi:hypothetical protein
VIVLTGYQPNTKIATHEKGQTRGLVSDRSEDVGRVGPPNASFKEIGVRAGTNKEDLIVVYVIDEEPIGLNMAFP